MKLINYLNKFNIDYALEDDNLTVGGDLDLRGTNISSLPDNLTVGGGLWLEGTNISSLPDNLTVGGGLWLRGTNISSLPDNLTVGGGLDLRGTNIIKSECQKIKKPTTQFMLNFKLSVEAKLSWKNGKYRKIDGIFCEVIRTLKNVLKVKIGLKFAFIFTKNNISAHGKTVKQAYRDWLFKTSDRDASKYENLKPDEIHELNFWIVAYRTITGACSFGTENYLENNQEKYKEKMTLKEVLEATKGQYRHSTFREFFEGTNND